MKLFQADQRRSSSSDDISAEDPTGATLRTLSPKPSTEDLKPSTAKTLRPNQSGVYKWIS